jgi:hypothetical protein
MPGGSRYRNRHQRGAAIDQRIIRMYVRISGTVAAMAATFTVAGEACHDDCRLT